MTQADIDDIARVAGRCAHEVLWGNIEANSLRGGIERSV